jgi:ectoine hydroxylase-related dioxygenase (phytanoyl-CoA dioxygenase family)
MTTATAQTPQETTSSEEIFDIDFWKSFCPDLTIGGALDPYAFPMSDEDKKKNNAKLIKEGYVQLFQPGLKAPIDTMTKLFDKIVVEKGLPPVFAFVYDEMWMLNTQLNNFLSHVLHDKYLMLPDFWAWRVSPGQAGWTPHRDKNAGALFVDKSPKSVTVWIPLTQAHPLNGCMYILPADRDPIYGIDNAQGFQGRLPDIRALPADPADVLIWTQQVMHWGARSADEHHLTPRMSVAFEYQRSDVQVFNKPLLKKQWLPTFEQRLALIAKQVMQYHHMYGFKPDLIAIAQQIIAKHPLPEPATA